MYALSHKTYKMTIRHARARRAHAIAACATGLLVSGVYAGNSTPATLLGSLGLRLSPHAEVALIATNDAASGISYDVIENGAPIDLTVQLSVFSKTALAMDVFELHNDNCAPRATVAFTAELCAATLQFGEQHTYVLAVRSLFIVTPLDPDAPWASISAVTLLQEVRDHGTAEALVEQADLAMRNSWVSEDELELEYGKIELSNAEADQSLGTLDPGEHEFDCSAPCVWNLSGTQMVCDTSFRHHVSAIFAAPLGTPNRGCLAGCDMSSKEGSGVPLCLDDCIAIFAAGLAPAVTGALDDLISCHAEAEGGYEQCLRIWCGTP